ncbi:hypothetical protein DESC_720424 [Desulfosarcina cetonica]|nr:hypothetical protein [Desulfosarcina cetonica]VTR69046.1 hypothetical protein DESC_720424 [Desulfosarcina cetonica]
MHPVTWAGKHVHNPAGNRRWNLNQGLISLQFDNRIVHCDYIPDLNMNHHNHPSFDILTDFWNLDDIHHGFSFN